jgi:hypothetical protein
VQAAAASAGVTVRRGLRVSVSTDSIVPHRAGYPTATLTSITPWNALANYHWPTDTPEDLVLATLLRAVDVAERRCGGAGPDPRWRGRTLQEGGRRVVAPGASLDVSDPGGDARRGGPAAWRLAGARGSS